MHRITLDGGPLELTFNPRRCGSPPLLATPLASVGWFWRQWGSRLVSVMAGPEPESILTQTEGS